MNVRPLGLAKLDVLLPYWTHGRDTALDVTVVNALQTALVHQIPKRGGKAVTHAHYAKIKKYQERCSKEGLEFVAMAVDTFGGWHPAALQILSKLGRQLGRVTGREEEDSA